MFHQTQIDASDSETIFVFIRPTVITNKMAVEVHARSVDGADAIRDNIRTKVS